MTYSFHSSNYPSKNTKSFLLLLILCFCLNSLPSTQLLLPNFLCQTSILHIQNVIKAQISTAFEQKQLTDSLWLRYRSGNISHSQFYLQMYDPQKIKTYEHNQYRVIQNFKALKQTLQPYFNLILHLSTEYEELLNEQQYERQSEKVEVYMQMILQIVDRDYSDFYKQKLFFLEAQERNCINLQLYKGRIFTQTLFKTTINYIHKENSAENVMMLLENCLLFDIHYDFVESIYKGFRLFKELRQKTQKDNPLFQLLRKLRNKENIRQKLEQLQVMFGNMERMNMQMKEEYQKQIQFAQSSDFNNIVISEKMYKLFGYMNKVSGIIKGRFQQILNQNRQEFNIYLGPSLMNNIQQVSGMNFLQFWIDFISSISHQFKTHKQRFTRSYLLGDKKEKQRNRQFI